MTIPLIQAQDGFEAVRDAMANILAAESVKQQAAAVAWNAAHPTDPQLNPDDWKLDIFVERTNPIELFRCDDTRDSLVVSIWYESSNTGNSTLANQVTTSRIIVDCLAAGVTTETDTGQEPADEVAKMRAQLVARLCRRILMHPEYKQFVLPSIVHYHRMTSRQSFPGNSPEIPTPHVSGVQLQFDVTHNEGFDFETLTASEGALITITRTPGGQVVAQMDYDWTV